METAAVRQIRTIPANPAYNFKAETAKRKRVCAYCRVSTESEEQLNSYAAQVNYYTNFIQNNPKWEFTGIYADEGITGTNVNQRKQFKRLIEDCKAGKIDTVYVKSISRFARNIVDCVSCIRELKEINVNIHFEKESIDTLDAKGELLIIILASIAEEESRNISENVRWGLEKRQAQGKVTIPFSQFLGYKRGEDGGIEIDTVEAVTVRRIYREFLDGKSAWQIAEGLREDGVSTATGRGKWYKSTVLSILQNEKYKGDAILQKTYKPDFLSKRRIKNEGQAKMYEVTNSHPPIIDRETFDKAQAELAKRNDKLENGKYSSAYAFSKKIRCGECGEHYRRHYQTQKDKKVRVWVCCRHVDKKDCAAKPIKETDLEQAFVKVMATLSGAQTDFLTGYEKEMIETEQNSLERKQADLQTLQQSLYELTKQGTENNREKLLTLMQSIDELTSEIAKLQSNCHRDLLIEHYKQTLQTATDTAKSPDTFDGELFKCLIDEVIVHSKSRLAFRFKCGLVMEVEK